MKRLVVVLAGPPPLVIVREMLESTDLDQLAVSREEMVLKLGNSSEQIVQVVIRSVECKQQEKVKPNAMAGACLSC